MVSINTNLSSLLVQNNLTQSTNGLSKAIERLTTGYKINHASDNAAGYSIAQNMTSQLSSYDIASDNISMGLDLLSVAQNTISQMQDRGQRLMSLWTQAQNGTFGQTSISAINQEATAIMQEINRLYINAEYNGIKLFEGDSGVEPPVDLKPQYNGFIAEAHHIDDATVNAMTHVAELNEFEEGETYAITTKEDLVNLATLVNEGNNANDVTFVMGADIDLSSIANWDAIGTNSNSFKGTFDGNGHKITNLKINKSDAGKQGLFGRVVNATIRNVGMDNVSVKGKEYTGSLVGDNDYSDIINCYAVSVDINGSSYYTGGLVGSSLYGNIINSYVAGNVIGTSSVGGLTGYTECAEITKCYTKVNVSGNMSIGGLIGFCQESSIFNSHAFGDVSGNKYVGGLIGYTNAVYDNTNLTNCTSHSLVSGSEFYGSFVGGIGYEDIIEYGVVTTSCSALVQENMKFLGGTIDECDSSKIDLEYELSNIEGITVDNASTCAFQVGIKGDVSSQITVNTGMNYNLEIADISQASAYDTINAFLLQLSEKATEFGAVSNRLESALESTTVAMENLTSSLSTIKDADIAQVSSDYIKKQILQQASATLLATANQAPSIALQLL